MELIRPWIEPISILFFAVGCGYFSRNVLHRRLKSWLGGTGSGMDELLLSSLKTYLPLWVFLAGISAAVHSAPVYEYHQTLVHKIVISIFFISVTLALSGFISGAADIYADLLSIPSAMTRLTSNLIQIVVVSLGAMLLLSNLGVSITPLLTALGVSSLAVALALQDTLGNFFAGIHIVVSDIVDVGDYIKLESGQEGVVVAVGWRTTRIKELSNNLIIVPNIKLAQGLLFNYHKPDCELAVIVPMAVSYSADLSQVEKVVLEVGREVQKTVAGAVPDFDPLLRYSSFEDSAVNFSVILRAKTYQERFLIIHEFIKRAHLRLRKEGIPFPFPQRWVHLLQTN